MAEYMHLIGAEQVQSAAGTIRDAAERISTAAGSMHDSIMRGLERADELVTRMEALAETAQRSGGPKGAAGPGGSVAPASPVAITAKEFEVLLDLARGADGITSTERIAQEVSSFIARKAQGGAGSHKPNGPRESECEAYVVGAPPASTCGTLPAPGAVGHDDDAGASRVSTARERRDGVPTGADTNHETALASPLSPDRDSLNDREAVGYTSKLTAAGGVGASGASPEASREEPPAASLPRPRGRVECSQEYVEKQVARAFRQAPLADTTEGWAKRAVAAVFEVCSPSTARRTITRAEWSDALRAYHAKARDYEALEAFLGVLGIEVEPA